VTISGLRSSLRATWLALIAVAGIAMLSGWHAASFHDDAHPGHAVAFHDAHGENETPKSDGHSQVHIAAHAIGQGFDLPVDMATPPLPVATQPTWLASAAPRRTAFEPSSLLRPPQA
jgi:hypothetical protein